MDNIENTSPSGEADVTASQGQLDATDTQPVETAEVVDGNEPVESGQASNPWDNDPKFKGKSSEDIYKAYKESEKLSGQLSQKAQVANLIQEKYGVTPEQLKSQIEQQELQQRQQYYAENPLAPLIDEVSQQRNYIEQMQAKEARASEENKLESFLKENPDYQTNRDQLLDLALNHPKYLNDDSIGYDQIANEWFGKTRAQGQQDAYKKIESKQNTQVTGVKSEPNRKFTQEDMDKMSASELEKILPWADTSNRPY